MANHSMTEADRTKTINQKLHEMDNLDARGLAFFLSGWYENDPEFNDAVERYLNYHSGFYAKATKLVSQEAI